MKKELVLILVLAMFCFSLVSASEFLTKVDFEISGFSGISSLDNSNGTDVVISIINSSGDVVVSRNAVAGVYLENMTLTMSGAKFNLSYSTQYTYNLSTIYGDFLYNFTTPDESGTSVLEWSADSGSGDWDTAGTYCDDLTEGGYEDWRLPTMSELLSSLSDQFIISPPTQTGFQDGTLYWSSSEHDSAIAWLAYNDFGIVSSSYDLKNYQGYSFRCVH